MAFDAASLRMTGSLNLATTATSALTFSSGSLAADSAGNIFANGIAARGTTFATSAHNGVGNALLRLSTSSALAIANSSNLIGAAPNTSLAAANFSSGSMILLPDLTDASGHVSHLALTADSEGDIFLLNRNSLAASANASVYQQIAGALSGNGNYPASAFFNRSAYFAVAGDRLKAFTMNNARLAGIPSMESSVSFAGAPAGIGISANAKQNAIVWLTESSSANEPAILHAFDAANLSREIYNSAQAAKNRDALGANIPSVPPTVANGRVFIATPAGIAVFGQRQ